MTYAIEEMELIFAIDDVEFVTQNGFLDLLVTGAHWFQSVNGDDNGGLQCTDRFE